MQEAGVKKTSFYKLVTILEKEEKDTVHIQ